MSSFEELYFEGDRDLKICSSNNSDYIAIKFNCDRLVTATELMQFADWLYEAAKKKYQR